MKIDSSHPPSRTGQSEANKAAESAKTAPVSATPAAVAHLSDNAQNSSQDIDAARVAEIRQAISEGRLDIRAERIADGLLASVRDLLGDNRT